MRRAMLSLVAVGFLTVLAGCKITQAHGVCDCDIDNHCYTRTPWPIAGAPVVLPAVPAEPIPAPGKAPGKL